MKDRVVKIGISFDQGFELRILGEDPIELTDPKEYKNETILRKGIISDVRIPDATHFRIEKEEKRRYFGG